MTTSIKPPRLLEGDMIGIAAPAGAFDRDLFSRGVGRIREAGYTPVFRDDIFERRGYLAGSDERRADELMGLFRDSRVRAIFCARGGYGCQRILPLLDAATIARNPKILMGYSDVTALHVFLGCACGLVSFHGPLVTELGGMDAETLGCLFALLSSPGPWGEVASDGVRDLRRGNSKGVLMGGSLSVFCAMLGTRYEPDTSGAILVFEDRNEKPYEVDRLFSQLRLAGKLDGACGLILGTFAPPKDSDGEAVEYREEIERIALEAAAGFSFPVISGFPAGHFGANICFPLGVGAEIEGERVRVIEPCLAE